MKKFLLVLLLLPLLFAVAVSEDVGLEEGSEEKAVENELEFFTSTFLAIALLLLIAKISSLITKMGQPAVLGELVAGLIIGNVVLFGIDFFEPMKHNEILLFLAELGVVILLFQIGLESNIHEMKKVGTNAFLVAIIGVVAPFVLGTYFVGPVLMPGLSDVTYLFLGAALTATSVGITARVFKDLGKLQTKEAQTILGAAVIDDVLGLIILAVVSAIATVGVVSGLEVAIIILKAILFLGGSIVIGQKLAPVFSEFFSKIHTGVAMKFTLAISLCLIFAYLAYLIGLAPIIGAFAIGLILDAVHFKFFKNPQIVDDIRSAVKGKQSDNVEKILDKHSEKHVEDLIEPLSNFVVPLFFVLTGMNVDLTALMDLDVLILAVAISLVAILGKVVAGIAAAKGCNKWLVGMGMVPRGEVGLIFASIGRGLGVLNAEQFSVVVVMVILTTLVAPPLLAMLLKEKK